MSSVEEQLNEIYPDNRYGDVLREQDYAKGIPQPSIRQIQQFAPTDNNLFNVYRPPFVTTASAIAHEKFYLGNMENWFNQTVPNLIDEDDPEFNVHEELEVLRADGRLPDSLWNRYLSGNHSYNDARNQGHLARLLRADLRHEEAERILGQSSFRATLGASAMMELTNPLNWLLGAGVPLAASQWVTKAGVAGKFARAYQSSRATFVATEAGAGYGLIGTEESISLLSNRNYTLREALVNTAVGGTLNAGIQGIIAGFLRFGMASGMEPVETTALTRGRGIGPEPTDISKRPYWGYTEVVDADQLPMPDMVRDQAAAEMQHVLESRYDLYFDGPRDRLLLPPSPEEAAAIRQRDLDIADELDAGEGLAVSAQNEAGLSRVDDVISRHTPETDELGPSGGDVRGKIYGILGIPEPGSDALFRVGLMRDRLARGHKAADLTSDETVKEVALAMLRNDARARGLDAEGLLNPQMSGLTDVGRRELVEKFTVQAREALEAIEQELATIDVDIVAPARATPEPPTPQQRIDTEHGKAANDTGDIEATRDFVLAKMQGEQETIDVQGTMTPRAQRLLEDNGKAVSDAADEAIELRQAEAMAKEMRTIEAGRATHPSPLEERISRFEAQARKDEGGRGIAVGAENINYRWKADALILLQRKVEQGTPIEQAVAETKAEARKWIKKHNSRRPKDANWQRWEGSADSEIDSAAGLLRKRTTQRQPWEITREEFGKAEGIGETGQSAEALVKTPPNQGMSLLSHGQETVTEHTPSAWSHHFPQTDKTATLTLVRTAKENGDERLLVFWEGKAGPIPRESFESGESMADAVGGVIVRDGKMLDIWVGTEFRGTGLAKFLKEESGSVGGIGPFATTKLANRAHGEFVEAALAEGRPVPPEVLADYPDLKPARVEAGEGATAKEGVRLTDFGSQGFKRAAVGTPKMSRGDVVAMAEKIAAKERPDTEVVYRDFEVWKRTAAQRTGYELGRKSYREVQAEAKKLGLKASGKKDDIVARITEKGEGGDFNVIRYNASTKAISRPDGTIYATVREIKKRSGQMQYEVKGYGKYEGQHPDLEDIYEARGQEEALQAAREIARRSAQPPDIIDAIGAASPVGIRPGNDDYWPATRTDLTGKFATATLYPGLHRWVGKQFAKMAKGYHLTPTTPLTWSPNAGVRHASSILIDQFIPLKGHVRGATMYTGQRLERAMTTIGSWRDESIKLHGTMKAEVARALGEGGVIRRTGSALGLDLHRNAEDLINRALRYHVHAKRNARILAREKAAGATQITPAVERLQQTLDARVAYELRDVPGDARQKILKAFEDHGRGMAELSLRYGNKTDASAALAGRWARTKNLVVIHYAPDIDSPARFDRAVGQVHTIRSSANTRGSSLQPKIDKNLHNSAHYAGQGFDPANPDHMAQMIAKVSGEEHLIAIDATKNIDALIDIIKNPDIIVSNFDTLSVLSGLNRGAVMDHYLKVVNDDFGITGPQRLTKWDQLAEYLNLHAVDFGVDRANPGHVRDNSVSIDTLMRRVRQIGEQTTNANLNANVEDFLAVGRNLTYATFLAHSVFTLSMDISQMVGRSLSREKNLFVGVYRTLDATRKAVQSMTPANQRLLREHMASLQGISREGSAAKRLTGYDPATRKPMSMTQQLATERSPLAEYATTVAVNATREFADGVIAGRLFGVNIPIAHELSMDGLLHGARRVSMFGYQKYFYDRVDDLLAISREMDTRQTPNAAEAIRDLRKRDVVKHYLDPDDWATVTRFLDTEKLEKLAAKRQAGDAIEIADALYFRGDDPEVRSWRDLLDHIMMHQDTPHPTGSTVPTSAAAGSELTRMFTTFTSFLSAFGAQNVAMMRTRRGGSNMTAFTLIFGAAMLDLFLRDWAKYDLDTAIERFKRDTETPEKKAQYITRIFGRTGYLGVVEKITEALGRAMFGNGMERRIAAERFLQPPLFGYGQDAARLIMGVGPKALRGEELTWSEKELVRRMSIITNTAPVRTAGNLLFGPSPPPTTGPARRAKPRQPSRPSPSRSRTRNPRRELRRELERSGR